MDHHYKSMRHILDDASLQNILQTILSVGSTYCTVFDTLAQATEQIPLSYVITVHADSSQCITESHDSW